MVAELIANELGHCAIVAPRSSLHESGAPLVIHDVQRLTLQLDGDTVELERETLHVMDDKRRAALVETRTRGNDGTVAQLVRYQFGNHLGSASLELDDQAQIIS